MSLAPMGEPQDWLKQGAGSAQEKIVFADEQLMATAGAKINTTGDVILTFAASSIVLAALLQAHQVIHHRRLAGLHIVKPSSLSSRTWDRLGVCLR